MTTERNERTASSELAQAPFVYTSLISGELLSSPPIPWFSETNPQIIITAHKAVKTPKVVMVLSIPRDTQIAGWLLKSLLIVQLTPALKESVATTWLEGITEYGTAENETDAITDLVISLGEYKEALEEREETLGDSARRELDYLRKLIERASEIDVERQKLELDITQEFEFADGEATLLTRLAEVLPSRMSETYVKHLQARFPQPPATDDPATYEFETHQD